MVRTEPNRQMNRKATHILATTLLLVLMVGCSAARPLHRSEVNIRGSLLRRTPFGTPRIEVEQFIARQGWRTEPVKDPPPPGWKQPRAAVMPPWGRLGNPPVPNESRTM